MSSYGAYTCLVVCCLAWTVPAIAQETDSGEGVCTPDDPAVRAGIERMFTDSELRGIARLDGVSPASLAVVTQEQTCRRLQNDVNRVYQVKGDDPEYEALYYQADNRYLVFINWIDPNKPDSVPPGMAYISEGMDILRVYDEDMVVIATVAL